MVWGTGTVPTQRLKLDPRIQEFEADMGNMVSPTSNM